MNNKEIEDVKKDLLEMGSLARRCIVNSLKVLLKREQGMVVALVQEDCSKIEELDVGIETKFETIFKSQALSKQDIAFAVACLKITSELKGISSLCIDIANAAKELTRKRAVETPLDFPVMCRICEETLSLNLEALHSKDAGKLGGITENEVLVNGIYDQIRRILLIHMIEEPGDMHSVENLRRIAKQFERIGDHNAEICSILLALLENSKSDAVNCQIAEASQR